MNSTNTQKAKRQKGPQHGIAWLQPISENSVTTYIRYGLLLENPIQIPVNKVISITCYTCTCCTCTCRCNSRDIIH